MQHDIKRTEKWKPVQITDRTWCIRRYKNKNIPTSAKMLEYLNR